MRVALIDNYDSFTYNLYHYLAELNCKVTVLRNDKFKIKNISKFKKIVISPGPGNPNQAGNCLELVDYYKNKIPILGVCLGHQIIGQVFGAKIVKAKTLMHGKTSKIKVNQKGIFKNLPRIIDGTRYHSLIIKNNTLPKSIEITAKTKDNLIMGIQHKIYNIHGIQFHPESINTKHGKTIIKNFINYE
jgi:anthranilate synthase/aminodeoxychorismate synthase-like glutamine amidotransferase